MNPIIAHALDLAAIVVAGTLAGNEFAVAVFFHPRIGALDDATHVRAAQALAAALGRVMPFWYALTLVLSLADAGRGDWVLCQVTSNAYGDPSAIPLDAVDFAAGGLLVASFARPGKLFTASTGLMVRSVGVLTKPALDRLLAAVIALLQPPSRPTT